VMPAKIDYGMIPVIEVARGLLGDESRERSTAVEKHFDGNGGLFVNTRKNRWYSHGNCKGGDAIELVRFVNACDFRESLNWLRLHGFESYVGADRSFGNIVAEYDYVSEDSEVLYQVVRFQPKRFAQRRPDGNGGWRWKGPDGAVPYRLPELLESGSAPVLIPGGEKDVASATLDLPQLAITAARGNGGPSSRHT
jgi:hypothetical protein